MKLTEFCRKEEQLQLHPLYGNIFGTFIVSEIRKHFYNRGLQSGLWFWRDNTGHETDIIIESGTRLFPVEIKSGQAITNEFLSPVEYWQSMLTLPITIFVKKCILYDCKRKI